MNKTVFDIKEEKAIPYYDQDKSIGKTLRNGGNSRGMNPLSYGLKRFKNYCLMLLAYITPFNALRVKMNKWKGVNVGQNVYIGMFVFLDNAYPEYIYIEDNVAINAGCMVVAHLNLKKHFEPIINARVSPVIIKDGAMIGIRSIILPGVVIGEFSLVSAATVVSEDVEAYTLVRGNPAVKISKYKKRMNVEME